MYKGEQVKRLLFLESGMMIEGWVDLDNCKW